MNDTDQTNAAPRRPLAGRLARGGAVALAVLAVLAVIFYTEENWRGKRAWDESKKRLESQQEVVDWGAYVPPAAPDDQNFFKAPKMQDWFVGNGSNELTARLALDSFEALTRERGRSNAPVLVTEWLVRAGGDGATNLEDSSSARLDTFKFDVVSLGEAIQRLARAAGLTVQIDPQVNSAPVAAVTGVWTNVTAQAVLLALMCNNNLRWVDDPASRGAGIIKAAELTPQAGVPDPANIVLAYLQNDLGPSVEAAESFPLAADNFQQRGPVRLWVAPDSIPAKGQMARLFVGGGSLRVEPAGNAVRVMLDQAPIAADDYLKWSDQFSPQIDLIRQAVKRPVSRLDGDYQQFGRMPGINFPAVRVAARMLSDRARCFLILGRPQEALDSLTLLHDLSNCLGARPGGKPVTLASASGIMALGGLHAETISAGLRLQAWGEPELRALQDQLSHVDLVPLAWSAMESERAWECHFFETAPRSEVAQTLELGGATTNLLEKLRNHKYLVMKLMPAGWVYQNMARMATLRQGAIDSVDRALGVVRPHQVEEARQRSVTVFRQSSPLSMLAKLATPPMNGPLTAAARAQALVNETLVVCALERYRLGRGLYPDRLDVLAPRLIPVLPVDPINGGALVYHHIGQGRFILYSIGWDEKDNGGAPMDADGKGDWVWGG
jgi:hypothetical protein